MLQKVDTERTEFLSRKVAKGRPYLYFRMPREFGGALLPLPVDEGSKEFAWQYDACLAKLRKRQVDANPPEPPKPRPKLARFPDGSIGRAIELYRASNAFKDLKPSTQHLYIGRLDKIKEQIGADPLREVDRDAAERFAELIYDESGSAQMSDLYVTLLGNIWKCVRKDEQFGIRKLPNPTIEIERKHRESDNQPHLRWPDELNDRFDDTAPANLVLARQVLHFTVQRGGDAVRMKWTDYDGKGVKVWPEKTTKKGRVVEPNYHLLPRVLIRALDAAKKTATSDHILVNVHGNRWATRRSLAQSIKAHLVKIGARKPKQKKGYTAHGLRHTGASEAAELPGASLKGIQSLTGHKSDRQPLWYIEQADQKKVNAAMVAAWSDELDRKEAEREKRRRAQRKALLKVVR